MNAAIAQKIRTARPFRFRVMAGSGARRAGLGKLLGTRKAGLAYRVLHHGNQYLGKNGGHPWSAGWIFVSRHHECEIAQVKTSPGARIRMCVYWMHSRHGRLPGGKMSKSLGNLVMVDQLMKTYSPDAAGA